MPGGTGPVGVDCPQCGQMVAVPPCGHVDADHDPALRHAILQDTLQQAACPHCQAPVRAEPRLTFTDAAQGLRVVAFPHGQLGAWRTLESEALNSAGTERIVFGWRALREKLLAADAVLDDVTLEKLKLLLMRDMQDPPLPLGAELRLSDVSAGKLTLTVLDRQGQALESLDVPPELVADIVADPEGWAPLDSALRAGPFVDVLRLIRG